MLSSGLQRQLSVKVRKPALIEKQRSLFGQFCCKSCKRGEAALVMHQERIHTCHCTYKESTLVTPENASLGSDCRLLPSKYLKATKRVCSWYRQSLLSMTSKSPQQTNLNKKNIVTIIQPGSVEISQPKRLFRSQHRYFSLCWLHFSKYVCPVLFFKFPKEKEK